MGQTAFSAYAFNPSYCLGFDGVGSVLMPSSTTVSGANNVSAAGQTANAAAGSKVLTGDLDSSLASLAQNLSMNKSAQPQVK